MSKLAWFVRVVAVVGAGVPGAFGVVGCGDDDGGAAAAGGSAAEDGGSAGRSVPRGGSGSSGAAGPSSGGGIFTAVIDGMPWEATPASIKARVDEDVPGGYVLEGTGGLSQHIELSLYYVDAPGTYSVGVDASVVGANGYVSRSTSIWQTPSSGAAGTLTITELHADRIKGRFELTAMALRGSPATGTVMITEGELDLPITDAVREIGPGHGRSVSAEIDGEPFNAATVVVSPIGGGISFNALNDAYNFGFLLSEVDAEGTYPLSLTPPSRAVAVVAGSNADQAGHCCWTVPPEDAGSITFTTLSTDRLVGSFEVTLDPMTGSAATDPLVVTSGVFDIGREEP